MSITLEGDSSSTAASDRPRGAPPSQMPLPTHRPAAPPLFHGGQMQQRMALSAPEEGRGSHTAVGVEGVSVSDSYKQRCNESVEALGKMTRRKSICGVDIFWSGDAYMYLAPTIFTTALVAGNMALVWTQLGWTEWIVCCVLLVTGYICSFLVTCTDPGVYPRLAPGEVDPLGDETRLVFCRVCLMRRPPRSAHCYTCGVCVLEHDHHCGIVGGCVGRRSLRWFTLYLVSVSSATLIGIVWMLRFLFTGVFALENMTQRIKGDIVTPAPTQGAAPTRYIRHRNHRPSVNNDNAELSFRYAGVIVIMIMDIVVLFLVGTLASIYVYLTLTSITRRESRRQENSWRLLCRPRMMWRNLVRAAFPPPSMLIRRMEKEEISELEQLV